MAHPAQTLKLARFLAVLASATLCAQTAFSNEAPAKSAATPKPSADPVASEPAIKPEEPIQTGVAGSFLSSRFARENKDLKQAAKYLNSSLAKDPTNLRLRGEALRFNLLAGNMDASVDLAKKLAADGENDPLIASLLMLDYVKSNDYASAKKVITAAPDTGLFGLIKPVMLQWIAIGNGEPKAPISMQAAIDKSGFFAPFITYHTALMNDVLGYKPEAEASYQKANADAAVAPYRVVQAYANYQSRNGKYTEAQQLFDNYAKMNPNSSLLPDKVAANVAPAPLVANAREGLAEVFFTTASLLFSDNSAQDTFLYLRIAMDLRPNLPPGQLMLANLYEQVGDYQQAIKTYDAIDPDTVFARRAQVRKALNYEAMGDKAKAVELLDALARKYPDDATALITKGDLLREAKDYNGAINAYSDAIKRSEPLEPSDWPLLYARGISNERGGNWDRAEADFQRALTLEPNQPDVLNYLAYSWLTMNKNTAKAREYLEIAVAARPDDPHIVDSVGWARYLAGDFKSAVDMFEKAIQLMPDDATVNEHLGDAYWRVGRETEARYQWERALTFHPDKDAEQGLRAKLEKGLGAFVMQPADKKPMQQSKAEIAPLKIQ